MAFNVGFDTSALDPRFKGHAQRGIGRYVTELSTYFSALKLGPIAVGSFDHSTFKAPSMASRLIDVLPAGRRTLSQQLLYPLRLNKGSFSAFDVVHFPAHMDAPAWSPKRYVLTVLDLIPLVFKELYKADRPSWRFHFARFLEIRAIKNASLILAISNNTAKDVHQILGIPYERILVTHLGVDQKFFKAQELSLSSNNQQYLKSKLGIPANRPIVLYVGGIDQRKNCQGLLAGFKELLGRALFHSKPLPVLVMAGGIQSDRQYPKLVELIKKYELQDFVHITGFVSEPELLALYAQSAAFFFPSLYEGFGLPPLEAMAAGVPVLSSGTSAMPEVLGTAALIYDPSDSVDAGQKLFDILYTPALAQKLHEAGPRQASKFTWSNTGEQTLKAYETLAKAA